MGVPVPEVKLPRKKTEKENQRADAKATLAPVDGALRKLGEKDLLLETGRDTVLRFRLLAKTQFRDKAGEPIRDSLLHPGDRLTVEVSPDDEETALRVVLVRGGSSAERAASERPVNEAVVRAPKAADLGKARQVSMGTKADNAESVEEPAARSEPASPPAAPDAPPAAPGAPPAGPGAPPTGPGAPPAAPGAAEPREPGAPPAIRRGTDDEIIAAAREASAAFSATLPSFLVHQVTSRYYSNSFPARWLSIDVVTCELAYSNGKEDYRDMRVDGVPVSRPPESTGAWSTGEFGTTLEDLMSLETHAAFHRRGSDHIGSRAAVVFDYTVEQPNSHWTIVSPDERRYSPAYHGSIWIDSETRRVLRIEQLTTGMPRDFYLSKAEAVLEYGYATIDQKRYLLPLSGENIGCMSGSGTCKRNAIEFRNYRKFEAESTIRY